MRTIYTRCTASRRNAFFSAINDATGHIQQAAASTSADERDMCRDIARWLICEARLDRLKGEDYPIIP